MRGKLKWLVPLALGALLLVGTAVVALAADPTPTATPDGAVCPMHGGAGGDGLGPGMMGPGGTAGPGVWGGMMGASGMMGPGGMMGGGGHGMMGPGFMMGGLEELADLLGMDVSDLTTQLRQGAKLADILAAKGVSVDAAVEALLAPQKDVLAVMVKYGRLTPAQADAMLKAMEEQIRAFIAGETPGRPGRPAPRGGSGTNWATGGMMGRW